MFLEAVHSIIRQVLCHFKTEVKSGTQSLSKTTT